MIIFDYTANNSTNTMVAKRLSTVMEQNNSILSSSFFNSIVGGGGIWTVDISIKKTKWCQPIKLQGS